MSDTNFDRFVQDLRRDPEFAARLDAARAQLRDDDDGSGSLVAPKGPRPTEPTDAAELNDPSVL